MLWCATVTAVKTGQDPRWLSCIAATPLIHLSFDSIESHVAYNGDPLFQAADHMNEILDFLVSFRTDSCCRCIDVLDLFSGKGAVLVEATLQKLKCKTFDILADRDEDLSSKICFFLVLGVDPTDAPAFHHHGWSAMQPVDLYVVVPTLQDG